MKRKSKTLVRISQIASNFQLIMRNPQSGHGKQVVRIRFKQMREIAVHDYELQRLENKKSWIWILRCLFFSTQEPLKLKEHNRELERYIGNKANFSITGSIYSISENHIKTERTRKKHESQIKLVTHRNPNRRI